MSHFAKLDKHNRVVFVTVGRQEDDGKELELTERTGDVYKQTSYNTRGGVHYDAQTGEPSDDQTKALRYNYAGIGFIYDEGRDAFIPPKPYESWVLDEATCNWVAPIPMPALEYDENGDALHLYRWDETEGDWVEVTDEAS